MAGHVYHGAVIRFVSGAGREAVARAALTTMKRAQRNVIAMGLVETGELAASFRTRNVTTNIMKPTYRVLSLDLKAKYPEFGTRGSVAAPGRWLVFKPKGSTTFVFAKKTKPVRRYGFMRKARDQLTKKDFLP
jgi:hypothetical protein